ncbi:Retinol dehydrogenase 12 [Rhizoctonia solani]|uniref:Retinol dehydrogenase 12 n=1 Tax=Rhizoctonia solani TaxID=456999 RepID=A0A0K6GIM5_9AGAM|nr:Retinol dehydrogenase 12 [Rhizoctonia solani]
MSNFLSQSCPLESLFDVEQIRDLTGQVMIVTGENTGIGKETCKVLLNKGARVYLAARSKSKVDAAIEWFKTETHGKAIFLGLDLANLASVCKAAEEFKSKEQVLHVLFNNAGNTGIGMETCEALLNKNAKVYLAARTPVFLELDLANLTSVRKAVEEFKSKEHQLHGVMAPPVDHRIADGYDLQFGTNVLGHYFFTTLLLPTLIHTAKTSPVAHEHARVVNTSSVILHWTPKGGIVWETLGTDISSVKAAKKLGATRLYAQSKLGNVLFSNELAKRYGDQGIISSSLHPGSIQTDLLRHWPWLIAKILEITLYPASCGALTQLWSGTMPEGENHNGKYLITWARVGDAEQVKGH